MNRTIEITADGSHTIFVPALNERYHSSHGAIQEAEHVFIRSALEAVAQIKNKIKILEIGFGTGLNALLTFKYSTGNNVSIIYTGIEKYPLLENEYMILNYCNTFYPELGDIFQELHKVQWDKSSNISDDFCLLKINTDLKDFNPAANSFDIIYFDAFGPDVQPDLWSNDIFLKLAAALSPGGILTTYSVKGDVKRALKNAGLRVEKLPGPPGKREITRAIKEI